MRLNWLSPLERLAHSLEPRPLQGTAQWAETNLKLPPETGAFRTDFSLYYGPHLHGVFAAMDDPKVESVYCMKASQVLWTTALIAYIFRRVDLMPGVMLGMFASEGAAKKFVLEKLNSMGQATDIVAEKIDFSTSRKKGNSLLRKHFDDGFYSLFGSNAIHGMKGTTAPFVFVEEPDDASENVGSQGDSIKLLFERTKRAPFNRKKILGGTPAVKGFSRVEEYINLSDKRVLPIFCQGCGDPHVLSFDQMVGWESDPTHSVDKHPIYGYNKPENAVYACPNCGDCWDDFTRQDNIRTTVNDAIERNDPLKGWVKTRNIDDVAGFTELSELYSCLPGDGQKKLVEAYLEAEHYASRGDNKKQIVFVNSRLGRPYEYQDGRDSSETLLENAKQDPESQRPAKLVAKGGLLITVGVDVQDNRLAVLIRAHGRERRSWLLFADEIYAKGGTENDQDPVYNELDKIVFDSFEHESGHTLYASAISIDTGGHATDAVYSWVLSRQKKYPAVKIFAVKGSSSRTDPPVFKHPEAKPLVHKNPDKMTKADRRGVRLYMVGTNKAKDYLADQLNMNSRGDGRFHFYRASDMRSDLFEHYVAESKIPDRSGRHVWKQKSGCPCEFWDCEVYAEHAARGLGIHGYEDKRWDDIERVLMQNDLFSESAPLVAQTQEDKPRQRRPSKFQRRV